MKGFKEFLNFLEEQVEILSESDGMSGPKSVGKRRLLFDFGDDDVLVYKISGYEIGYLNSNMRPDNVIIDSISKQFHEINTSSQLGILTLTREDGNRFSTLRTVYVVKLPDNKGGIGALSAPTVLILKGNPKQYTKSIQNVFPGLVSCSYMFKKETQIIKVPDLTPNVLGIVGEWFSLDRYVEKLQYGIQSLSSSGQLSENGAKMLNYLLNTVVYGRGDPETKELFTSEEGKKVLGQMKYFGECLGPLKLLLDRSYSWWMFSTWDPSQYSGYGTGLTNNSSQIYIPSSSIEALIDYKVKTESEEGEIVWNISAKMKAGGNTIKSGSLEDIFNDDTGEQWRRLDGDRNLQARIIKAENDPKYQPMRWARKVLNDLYSGIMWWGTIYTAAHVFDGPEAVGMRADQIGQLLSNIYRRNNFNQYKNASSSEQLDILIDLDPGPNSTNREAELLSTIWKGNTSPNKVEPYDDAITLRQLHYTSGKYLQQLTSLRSSIRNPAFSEGIRQWFEMAISDQVYYMFLEMNGSEMNWTLKGVHTLSAVVEKFKKVSLRFKDSNNRIGLSVENYMHNNEFPGLVLDYDISRPQI